MITQFGIHLKVKDITKSYEFYKSFGLNPVFAYGNNHFLKKFKPSIPTVSEKYNGVSFDINGAIFEIADGHVAVKAEVFQKTIDSSKVSAMLTVPSVQKVIQACKLHNYSIAVPPQKFPWGTKEIVIKDPDGFVLVFVEKLT